MPGMNKVEFNLHTALTAWQWSPFSMAVAAALVAIGYLIYKLLYWDRFSGGIAPLVIGIFFFGSIQLISVGILGEYIGAIHTHAQKRPLVIERERVNFEHEPGFPKPLSIASNAAVK